jgi:hypothetical protein
MPKNGEQPNATAEPKGKSKQDRGRVVALPRKIADAMNDLSKRSGVPVARIRKVVEAEVTRHLAGFDLKAALKAELFN